MAKSIMVRVAIKKHELQCFLCDKIENSYIQVNPMDLNEFKYYLGSLLNHVEDNSDFWNVFPTFSHTLLAEVLGENDKANIQNLQVQEESMDKYPIGASLLRECAFLLMVDKEDKE